MEPGHEDREYRAEGRGVARVDVASMEPGHEDREYRLSYCDSYDVVAPQWSPVMKTGNTHRIAAGNLYARLPQWSPVMKTGNTSTRASRTRRPSSLNGARS